MSDAKGPEHVVLVATTQAVQAGNTPYGISYVRADLYDAMKKERDQLKDELAGTKAALYTEALERDRYRNLCEEALSVFDSGPIQFSRDNVEIIAKLREALNPQEHGGGDET